MAGYIGVDGKAQPVTGAYVGVDGKARRVLKAYVGDENGKARLWYEVVRKNITFTIRIRTERYSEEYEDVEFHCPEWTTMEQWLQTKPSCEYGYYEVLVPFDDETGDNAVIRFVHASGGNSYGSADKHVIRDGSYFSNFVNLKESEATV